MEKKKGMIFGKLNIIDLAILLVVIAAVAFFAPVGDLVESIIKRSFEIKDSGNIFPGHGGVLDRFDSLLFTAPVIYYALLFISIFRMYEF